MAQNFETISQHYHFGTRRTTFLVGFNDSTMLLPGTNCKSHGQNSFTPEIILGII